MFLYWVIQAQKLKNSYEIGDFLIFSISESFKLAHEDLSSTDFKFYVIYTLSFKGSKKIKAQKIRKKKLLDLENAIFSEFSHRPGKIENFWKMKSQ